MTNTNSILDILGVLGFFLALLPLIVDVVKNVKRGHARFIVTVLDTNQLRITNVGESNAINVRYRLSGTHNDKHILDEEEIPPLSVGQHYDVKYDLDCESMFPRRLSVHLVWREHILWNIKYKYELRQNILEVVKCPNMEWTGTITMSPIQVGERHDNNEIDEYLPAP